MMCLTFETRSKERGPYVLVIVLEKKNLDRMKQGNPLDMNFKGQFSALLGCLTPQSAIMDLDIVVCYEENLNKIMEFQKNKDLPGLMNYLERGRKHQPGDVLPPFKLRKQ